MLRELPRRCWVEAVSVAFAHTHTRCRHPRHVSIDRRSLLPDWTWWEVFAWDRGFLFGAILDGWEYLVGCIRSRPSWKVIGGRFRREGSKWLEYFICLNDMAAKIFSSCTNALRLPILRRRECALRFHSKVFELVRQATGRTTEYNCKTYATRRCSSRTL